MCFEVVYFLMEVHTHAAVRDSRLLTKEEPVLIVPPSKCGALPLFPFEVVRGFLFLVIVLRSLSLLQKHDAT